MYLILIVALVLILLGALPIWPYSAWVGYGPSGAVAVILIVIILLFAFGGFRL